MFSSIMLKHDDRFFVELPAFTCCQPLNGRKYGSDLYSLLVSRIEAKFGTLNLLTMYIHSEKAEINLPFS